MNVSNINYTTKPLNFELKEVDVYTQITFENLINQRLTNGFSYYICKIEEKEKTYTFDGESFIENYVHNQNFTNPMTRKEIKDFNIYVISPGDTDFKLYMNKKAILTPPNHLPLFWNNPNRPVESRIYFLLEYGKGLETSKIESSISAYEKASSLGSITAKLRLSRIYGQKGNKDLTIKWLKESIASEEISARNAFCCGKQFEMCDRLDLALEAYSVSANKSNVLGLAELIKILEEMQGVDNKHEITKQRQKLPEAWREAPIAGFFKHLQEINYTYDRTGYP